MKWHYIDAYMPRAYQLLRLLQIRLKFPILLSSYVVPVYLELGRETRRILNSKNFYFLISQIPSNAAALFGAYLSYRTAKGWISCGFWLETMRYNKWPFRSFLTRVYLFSTYVKLSEKLIFLTPSHAHQSFRNW